MEPIDPARQGSRDRAWSRAVGYVTTGQYRAARAVLDVMLARVPNDAQALVLRSDVHLAERHLRAACADLCAAARVLPDDLSAIIHVAYRLYCVGETTAMRDCLRSPAVRTTRSPAALARIAYMWQLLGKHGEALKTMERAADAGFTDPEFDYQHCMALLFNGDVPGARRALGRCIQEHPEIGRAMLTLTRLSRATTVNDLRSITRALPHTQPGSVDRAALEFASFQELSALERYQDAWAALVRGNGIMRARTEWDAASVARQVAATKRTCSASFVTSSGYRARGPVPIFIIGLPRSGTTLVERIVSNHSHVASCGELLDFPHQMHWASDTYSSVPISDLTLERAPNIDYAEVGARYLEQTQWRAGGRPYYVDKLPENLFFAGFIHRALPDARILHVVRDPMDVCFSNWSTLFNGAHGYSYRLEALPPYYAQCRALMSHWHRVMPGTVLDVRYEALVRKPAEAAARILRFCGLSPEPGCADITRNHAPVATLSAVQVRQPIDGGSFGAWRPYRVETGSLRAALESISFGTG